MMLSPHRIVLEPELDLALLIPFGKHSRGRASEDQVWWGQGGGWLQLPGDESNTASPVLVLFRAGGETACAMEDRCWSLYVCETSVPALIFLLRS